MSLAARINHPRARCECGKRAVYRVMVTIRTPGGTPDTGPLLLCPVCYVAYLEEELAGGRRRDEDVVRLDRYAVQRIQEIITAYISLLSEGPHDRNRRHRIAEAKMIQRILEDFDGTQSQGRAQVARRQSRSATRRRS